MTSLELDVMYGAGTALQGSWLFFCLGTMHASALRRVRCLKDYIIQDKFSMRRLHYIIDLKKSFTLKRQLIVY